jgi:hypothetical protein
LNYCNFWLRSGLFGGDQDGLVDRVGLDRELSLPNDGKVIADEHG